MPATNTSREAYNEHVINGQATSQREKLLSYLQRSALSLTRYQLHLVTGIRLTSVCGRVNALMDAGQVEIERVDVDPQTGKKAEYLRAAEPAPAMVQGALL